MRAQPAEAPLSTASIRFIQLVVAAVVLASLATVGVVQFSEPSGAQVNASSLEHETVTNYSPYICGEANSTLWFGEDVVVVIAGATAEDAAAIDRTAMARVVANIDRLDDMHEEVTGRRPVLASPYNGKIRVEIGSCGYGGLANHGTLGYHIGRAFFWEMYDLALEGRDAIHQVFFYESARNYWMRDMNPAIDYHTSNSESSYGWWTVGFNNATACIYSLEMDVELIYAGRVGRQWCGDLHDYFNQYTSDPQWNWENTWLSDLMPWWSSPRSINGLMSATLIELHNRTTGIDFYSRLYCTIPIQDSLSSRSDYAGVRDNFYRAASHAAEQDLYEFFTADLRWELTDAAQRDVEQLAAAGYALPSTCANATPTATPTPTAVPTSTPQPQPTSVVLYRADFETDTWEQDPNGSDPDTATTGFWEAVSPEQTAYRGSTMQLGEPAGGQRSLVTGGSAGRSVGTYDIDGGRVSAASPAVEVGSETSLTLSFDYYFAHMDPSNDDDYFTVKLVGENDEAVVFEQLGTRSIRTAEWQSQIVTIDRDLGGTSVRIVVEAADGGQPSLIEAAIDNVELRAEASGPTPADPDPEPVIIFDEHFNAGQNWTSNPYGTDEGVSGDWQIADPKPTSYNGTELQPQDAYDDTMALVTGGDSGRAPGSYDIDGGDVSIASPQFAVPRGATELVIDFAWYFAHLASSDSSDYLRVSLDDGANRTVVFEQLGDGTNAAHTWQVTSVSADVQAIGPMRLLVEAADGAGGGLVEAGIDAITITAN